MTPLLIAVDTREQTPFRFPPTLSLRTGTRRRVVRLATERRTLKAGDYAYADALIERKGSLQELASNLGHRYGPKGYPIKRDRPRFLRALDALAEAAPRPWLLVEESAATLLSPTRVVPHPGDVWDDLLAECGSRNIRISLVGKASTPKARLAVGQMVARILISEATA